MLTHKIVSSTKKEFEGIELNFTPKDKSIGDEVSILGGEFTITQTGVIYVLSSEKWNLTLMEVVG